MDLLLVTPTPIGTGDYDLETMQENPVSLAEFSAQAIGLVPHLNVLPIVSLLGLNLYQVLGTRSIAVVDTLVNAG